MKKRKQQRWVLRLPSLVVMMTAAADGALLMAFFQVCGVFGGCDDVSLGNCVRQLSTYERQVGDGNITYTESELDELCRRYDDIAVCVRRATSTCPAEPSTHFVSLKKKQVWSGLDASFNFICKNGKRTYLNHVQCLSTHPIPSSLRLCNRTFHRDWTFIREKDFAHDDRNQELCLITNKFLECLYGVVRKHCGEEAATWEITVIQKLRQPKMELDYGCTLGCSTVRHRMIGFLLTVLLLIERLT